MKLLKNALYLTKDQWRKVFLAMSIMTLVLYTVAMVFSLCGSDYFILKYQNERMDKIEEFLTLYGIMPMLNCMFLTLEFSIVSSFVLNRITRFWYPLAFYVIAVLVAVIYPKVPSFFYTIYPFVFHFIIPIVEQLISTKRVSFKVYLKQLLRLLIAVAVVYTLQIMIFVIKNGSFSLENHIQPLATAFVFAIEYDIALLVILFTISLFINREKGDSIWATFHNHGSFSQISKKKSQKSNLTKTQKNKLRLLYLKFYLTQLGAFLLLMVLPFLLGKVFEFLVMYTSFAIVRYILGFKYSLHYKKETLCISVGAVVFGILSLAVPFFYVVVIMAIVMGIALAVLLHLSYKYKGFYLFNLMSKPDKFAELYVLMDGNLEPHHVEIICRHRGLDKEQTKIMLLLAEGNKKSYIAKQMGYEVKTIERRINEALDKLYNNS